MLSRFLHLSSPLVAGQKPLTEVECLTLANTEIDFAVSKVSAEMRNPSMVSCQQGR